FSSGKYGCEQIHVMDADGSNVAKLTDEELECHDPSWSPDGKKIVFSAGKVRRPGGEEVLYGHWDSIFIVDIDSHSVTDLIAAFLCIP
ncbi:unnamed protein product, partial [marine sediment metagenome]